MDVALVNSIGVKPKLNTDFTKFFFENIRIEIGQFFDYVTFSPSRSVRCVTNKPPAMRVRDEGYTKKTPNAIQ